MGAFSTGVQAGAQTPVANPFGAILSRFNEAQARRMKEDDERKKEEFQLKKALEVLSKQNEYETSQKQEARSYEEGKQRREEGLEKRKSLFDAYTSGELNLSDEEAQGLLEEFGLSKGARPAQPAQRSVLPEVQGDKTQRLLELTGLSMPTKKQGATSTAKGIVQQAGIAPRDRINESMKNKKQRLEIEKLEMELDPEAGQRKAAQKGAEEATKKAFESSEKLGQAIRRLSVINKQFKEALPSGNKTPAQQRVAAFTDVIGAKTGLKPNPRLLALKKNVRPMAINLIRLFGEVGNLSQSEQQGAMDTVEMEGLTDTERMASVKQFAEFALAGSTPEAINYMMKQKDIKDIISLFEIDLPQASQEETGGTSLSAEQRSALIEKIRAKNANR